MRDQCQLAGKAGPARPALARTKPSPGAGTAPSARTVLDLQCAIGNTAVSALITARHRAGVPDVLRSAGQPIDAGLRAEMEARMGADFADVRVHTDTAAQRSAAELGARAYTSGHHIVVGAGGMDDHTLAHELTHVIQQREGPVAGTERDGLLVSDPADRFERAAEANAGRVMRGPRPAPAAAPAHGFATGRQVQRTTIGEHIDTTFRERQGQFQDLVQRVLSGASEAVRLEIAQALMQRYRWSQEELAAQGGAQLLWHLGDVLLDPAYDFNGSADLAEELAAQFGPEQGLDLLRRDILDPVHFASCYPTARHLFPLLSGLIANQDETREQLADRAADAALGKGASNDVDAQPDGDSFRAEVGRLVAAIADANAHDVEAVFRIEFAGHGFTLVLRHPQADQPLHVELIESLAHAASLDRSLRRAGRPVGAVRHDLVGMADDDFATRSAAASRFGWNAAALFLHDTGNDPANPISSYAEQRARGENAHIGEYFPRTRIKWWANRLDAGALNRWGEQATARFMRLDRLFPAAGPSNT